MSLIAPAQIGLAFSNASLEKARLPYTRFILLAVLGGCFIAFGGLLSVVVAGNLPELQLHNPGLVKWISGALFPVGLIMVSVAGADLFTSDCAGMLLPWMRKQLTWKDLLIVWSLSYFFNFVGAQFVAWLMTHQTGILEGSSALKYVHNLAEHKLQSDFWTVFIKGIGANWLVCLGTWMGFASKDLSGKALGIWIPVMLFVTLGYEHSIANMFFIPTAIYTGADIQWSSFVVDNLIPATLGNIVGGAVLVGGIYAYIFGLNKQVNPD